MGAEQCCSAGQVPQKYTNGCHAWDTMPLLRAGKDCSGWVKQRALKAGRPPCPARPRWKKLGRERPLIGMASCLAAVPRRECLTAQPPPPDPADRARRAPQPPSGPWGRPRAHRQALLLQRVGEWAGRRGSSDGGQAGTTAGSGEATQAVHTTLPKTTPALPSAPAAA